MWCLGAESNHRHCDFQSHALPTELPRQMAMRKGLEPSTSSVTGWHSNQLNYRTRYGGNNRARTCDPLLVRQMLSQLSYAPSPSRSPRRLVYNTSIPGICQYPIWCFNHFYLCIRAMAKIHAQNTKASTSAAGAHFQKKRVLTRLPIFSRQWLN